MEITTSTDEQPPAARPRGLVCRSCGGTKWKTLHTRPAVGRVVRSRQCRGCGAVVRTAERVEAVPAVVNVAYVPLRPAK